MGQNETKQKRKSQVLQVYKERQRCGGVGLATPGCGLCHLMGSLHGLGWPDPAAHIQLVRSPQWHIRRLVS